MILELSNNPTGKENVKNQSYRKQQNMNNNQENKNPLGKQSNNMNNPSGLMNGHRNQNYQSNGSGTSSGGMQPQPIQYIKYAPAPTELMSNHGAMNYNPNTSGAYNQALMYQHQQGNAGSQLNNPNVKSYATSSMPMRMNKNLLNANQ